MVSRLTLLVVGLIVCVLGVQHVHLVDQYGKNWLFRGGSPEVKGKFSVSALMSSLSAAAPGLPSRYELVVVNVENLDDKLLRFSSDGPNVLSEHAYFANNASAGEFHFWHMVGVGVRPSDALFNGQLGWLSQSYPEWGSDKLVERTDRLRLMLQQSATLPRVIYFHCDCGCDRTGQLAGAYAMKYQNKTWDQVCDWNWKVAGRPQLCRYQYQMQWYCVYLANVTGVKTVGNCLKEHLCTPL